MNPLTSKATCTRPARTGRSSRKLVTHPRNRYFAQNFVNRLWAELMGRGIYEPVDDYSEYQAVSHPDTLEFIARNSLRWDMTSRK